MNRSPSAWPARHREPVVGWRRGQPTRRGMPMSSDSQYVHGTHPEEQARLTRLNTLLNEGSLRELAARPGERMLDVGSGLGQFARAVAKITGVTSVGVERSEQQLGESACQARAAGEEHLLDLRRGDARHLPLED